jgi:Domain of unknown function (DUF4124)
MTRALPVLSVVALVSLFGPAVAAVYKCADASGKVVIGDHPCVSAQAVPARNASAPVASTNAVGVVQTPESKRAVSLARIRAAQTPECLALGDRIVLAASDARAASAPDMEQVMAQYQKQCAGRAKVAIQSEANRQDAEEKRNEKLLQKDVACTEKRRNLDERRAKLDSLNAQDKLAWARLLEEVSRECSK